MDILVTGADGQLGHWMRNVSSRSGDRYVFTDVRRSVDGKVDMLDITDAQAVSDAVGSLRPGVIVNCAAYTDVDKAEDEPEKADIEKIEAMKCVKGSFTQSGQFQVIIGNTVADFYNDFTAVAGIEGVSKDEVKQAAKKNQNVLQRMVTALAEIFAMSEKLGWNE